jgi:hypothetical protein
MLEPRIVVARPTADTWTLDLSYESESLKFNKTAAASPVQNNITAVSTEDSEKDGLREITIEATLTPVPTPVRNNTPAIFTNGEDGLQEIDMEATLMAVQTPVCSNIPSASTNAENGLHEIRMEATVAAASTLIQRNTSANSINEKNGVHDMAIDDEGTSYSLEGIGNEDAVEYQGNAPIDDEFLCLAKTLESLGRNRVQELVCLIQSIFLHSELTSTYVDYYALYRNFKDLIQGEVGQETYSSFPS